MPGIESRLNDIWYSDYPPPRLLRFLEHCYAGVTRRRNTVSTEILPIPLVVIGNFTVGGTGKTPLIVSIVEHLQRIGHKPGVISRGYGRTGKTAYSLNRNSSAEESGDEPLLIYRRTGAPVQVDSDRLAAAKKIIAEGCDVIVSDDGLQHHKLPRTLEIEVFDALRGYGNGHLLPAGPLREVPRAVDFRIGNGQVGDSQSAFGMQLVVDRCYRLHDEAEKSLSEFIGQSVHAVAGIGNPGRFFKTLTDAGLQITEHAYPDHHRFTDSDLPSGTVLMTEKDAVKCLKSDRTDLWSVPVDALASDDFYRSFQAKLFGAGGKNV
jgi:tetraacyldisaccharide 4'-kinase